MHDRKVLYLYEDELKSFLEDGLASSTTLILDAVAFSWDDESVFHVHLDYPKSYVSGRPIRTRIIYTEDALDTLDEAFVHAFIAEHAMSFDGIEKGVLCCFFAYNGSFFEKKSFYFTTATIIECETRYVPLEADLYSRSKGLLEVDVLGKKSVAIVGLGSFGSHVSIELAKSGIGEFHLFDFDRLELANVARHTSGVSELGRYKTCSVRDAILQKNPYAIVNTYEVNINEQQGVFEAVVKDVDIVLALTDENQSRYLINHLALKHKKCALFGRAITRAEAGDVFRLRGYDHKSPCLVCLMGLNIFSYREEEYSTEKQVDRELPAYTSQADKDAKVQVGLSSDIIPICNMIVKLALVELSKGLDAGIASLEEDLQSDYYFWVNRREEKYKEWLPMGYKVDRLSVMRWYGLRISKEQECMACLR